MDDFDNSDKKYLIFDRFILIHTKLHKMVWASLVVTRSLYLNFEEDDGLTMTDLKKKHGTIGYYNTPFWPRRLSSLCKALIKAANKMTDTEKIVAFDFPIRLGGQTYANQTGYGSEYSGAELVYQGTLTIIFCLPCG